MKFTLFLTLAIVPLLPAADQPQWGQKNTRNMISEERGLPEAFDPATNQNIVWMAPLGGQTHSTPVVAGGLVYIGTSNEAPRDPLLPADSGVMLCLDEQDGHLLWQLVVPKRTEDQYFDWPKTGMASPVTVEGDRAYMVSNRGEVMCLDVAGMTNGNDGPFKDEAIHMRPFAAPAPDFKPEYPKSETPLPEPSKTDADIIWLYDMPQQSHTWPHDGAHSSILVLGDFLYLNTGNGVDNTHRVVRRPEAPSFIVLDKKTGKLVAQDDEKIGDNIFHATWSSPSYAEVNGKPLVFFAGGDGIVRAFEPVSKAPADGTVATLKKVWWCDIDPSAPKENVHRFTTNRKESPSDIYGMPVFYKVKIYVAGGGDIWWGKNEAWMKCIDATKTGDVTSKAEIWSTPLDHHVMTTPAIKDGLLFIADTRNLHCLDVETGKEHWQQDLGGEIWASPMLADGKVFIGTRKGDYWIFEASKERKILSNLIGKSGYSATATAANGALYLATQKQLLKLRAHPVANDKL